MFIQLRRIRVYYSAQYTAFMLPLFGWPYSGHVLIFRSFLCNLCTALIISLIWPTRLSIPEKCRCYYVLCVKIIVHTRSAIEKYVLARDSFHQHIVESYDVHYCRVANLSSIHIECHSIRCCNGLATSCLVPSLHWVAYSRLVNSTRHSSVFPGIVLAIAR